VRNVGFEPGTTDSAQQPNELKDYNFYLYSQSESQMMRALIITAILPKHK
jgi:hypothetical protein